MLWENILAFGLRVMGYGFISPEISEQNSKLPRTTQHATRISKG
jgi:hypothetical protein